MGAVYATAGPGDGPNLSAWPLLAWTKNEGVVTEDKQIPVAAIREAATEFSAAQIAEALGTTAGHVEQALDYLKVSA